MTKVVIFYEPQNFFFIFLFHRAISFFGVVYYTLAGYSYRASTFTVNVVRNREVANSYNVKTYQDIYFRHNPRVYDHIRKSLPCGKDNIRSIRLVHRVMVHTHTSSYAELFQPEGIHYPLGYMRVCTSGIPQGTKFHTLLASGFSHYTFANNFPEILSRQG